MGHDQGAHSVSLYFGILSAIITYSVCIPLGVVKAIRHKSLVDNISSVLIFLGYSYLGSPGRRTGGVSGRAAGMVPLCGLTSPDFATWGSGNRPETCSPYGAPLICYVVSSFAITMMMKNNLMDNLSADYIRTAMAKA
ncbi:MAG: hypothetical protein ACLSUW_01090 [Akkermansia sp.]